MPEPDDDLLGFKPLQDGDFEQFCYKVDELAALLSSEQPWPLTALQERIATQLRETPRITNRAIGRLLRIDGKTVQRVRLILEERGEIRRFAKRLDPRTGRATQAAKRFNKGAS